MLRILGPSAAAVLRPDSTSPRRTVDLRSAAAQTLKIRPAAAPAVAEFTVLLRSNDPHVCCTAARALGAIGPSAASAVPELIKLLHDERSYVRY